jgi:hypothetical protein
METTAKIKCVGIGVAAFLITGAPLWAADAARDDDSSIFVWIFLAFCALIVVAQLIPAVLMMFGFAKGVKKETAQSASAVDHAPSPDA